MNDDTEVLPRTPTEAEHEDLNSAIAHAAPKRWWNRTTLVLAGVVLLIGGFAGGAQVQKHWGSSSAAAPSTSGGGAPTGAGMPSGMGAFGQNQNRAATPGSATAGTISKIDGDTVYVQTAAGEIVTVRASDTTTVSKSTTATMADLTAGLKITVQGVADSEGVVTATAIIAG